MKRDFPRYAVGLDSTLDAIRKIDYERGLKEGQRMTKRVRLTELDRAALSRAIGFALSGEYEPEGDRARLESVKEKLNTFYWDGDSLADIRSSLREILPLAEAYLKGAPGHPDNAKIETARAHVEAA